jgi:hypothetical protein
MYDHFIYVHSWPPLREVGAPNGQDYLWGHLRQVKSSSSSSPSGMPRYCCTVCDSRSRDFCTQVSAGCQSHVVARLSEKCGSPVFGPLKCVFKVWFDNVCRIDQGYNRMVTWVLSRSWPTFPEMHTEGRQ